MLGLTNLKVSKPWNAKPCVLGDRGFVNPRRSCSRNCEQINRVRVPATLDCDSAKLLMENEGYLFIDMRSAKEYDHEHITKPPRKTVNIPCSDLATFVSEITGKFKSPDAKLLLVCRKGDLGIQSANILEEQGYTSVCGVQGGFDGWMERWTTSGRRRIVGKFVSSGRESLKSGLNLDPEVASTYEENWGHPELSLPSNRTKS